MLLGARLRAIRLEQGLTREVLGERSRVSADTIKRFEHTGRATLDTLVRICLVLGVLGEVSGLFQTRGPRTLAELEVRHTRPARVRGQRSDAGRSRARKTDEPQSHGQ
ncbi:MAG: helix-turn-helix transcriptional regulator [Gemmatimonadaceae bacterium]